MSYRKKLIEVALPLEEINAASAREKSIRHGHPSTLHLWWARRPLATCRAVIFSQIVDDPGEEGAPEAYLRRIDELPMHSKYRHLAAEEPVDAEGKPLKGEAAKKEKLARDRRFRLFTLIEQLVQWENTTNEDVLEPARELIRLACTPSCPPETDDFFEILIWAFEQVGDSQVGHDRFGDTTILAEKRRRLWDAFRRTSKVEAPLEELRGVLFFMQRCHRMSDTSGPPDVEVEKFVRALYSQARKQWDAEVKPEVPPLHDPFCGGGSIPLEAQRLGLEAYGSDLNPVAVLITKAMIEIPPKFAGLPPVNPEARAGLGTKTWKGAQGLAEDVRYYGKWMRDEAEKRIGHLYPKVKAIRNPDGTYRYATEDEIQNPKSKIENLTVIAWLWARTVKSPNPAFRDVDVPLASTFMLSTKAGKEAYVEPLIEGHGYRFEVRNGKPRNLEATKKGTKVSQGSFRCLMSDTAMPYAYIDDEANAGRMGARLMAIVAEGARGRIYLPPTEDMEAIARSAEPAWKPDTPCRGTWASNAQGRIYGFRTFGDYFTDRQLVALATFSDLVQEAMEKVEQDALAAAGACDERSEQNPNPYAVAVTTYLGLALSRLSDVCNSLCGWETSKTQVRHLFTRQAIPMVWDFGENNVFGNAAGDYGVSLGNLIRALQKMPSAGFGRAAQEDAQTQQTGVAKLISTDPPYYDNVGYADLSDFFYVWLRRSIGDLFPKFFATVAAPKTEELVATPYRHGGREAAESFFLNGMTLAMARLGEQAASSFPVTIYYAFKQSETEADGGTASTGWETFLEAVLKAGFAIGGTWPMRTELANKVSGIGANMLASSVVIVCRTKSSTAGSITRREFQDELRRVLPGALQKLTQANVAPVDLAQASIGPGMEVFTRYAEVLEATGERMTVKTALQLINGVLDEVLEAQEGWYDDETRFAVRWFAQNGFKDGPYGDADNLARARGTAPDALVDFGFARSGGGRFKLLSRDELKADYDPAADRRTAIWEACQYLGRALDQGGEDGAARLMRRFRETKPELDIDRARELAYRLYAICDRKKWAAEAQIYNALVTTWSEIETKSQSDTAAWIGAGESAQPGGQRELGV